MQREEIDALISQLNGIRLEQDTLRTQEKELVDRIIEAQKREVPDVQQTKSPPSPTKGLKKEPFFDQDTGTKSVKNKKKKSEEEFAVGTRVRILNAKPRNGSRYPSEADKTGTVTRKTAFFVFINTDNPTDAKEVRRARSNLKRI